MTLVNAMLCILPAKDVDILLCVPTKRHTTRMSEATGFEATTIPPAALDRFQDLRVPARLREPARSLLMVDVLPMHSPLVAVSDRTTLLTVGDVDQLPSRVPRQALANVIASGTVPVMSLSNVFRPNTGGGFDIGTDIQGWEDTEGQRQH